MKAIFHDLTVGNALFWNNLTFSLQALSVPNSFNHLHGLLFQKLRSISDFAWSCLFSGLISPPPPDPDRANNPLPTPPFTTLYTVHSQLGNKNTTEYRYRDSAVLLSDSLGAPKALIHIVCGWMVQIYASEFEHVSLLVRFFYSPWLRSSNKPINPLLNDSMHDLWDLKHSSMCRG
jgi:hypothetical protein